MLIRKETVRTVIALANCAAGGHVSTNDKHLLETARNSIGGGLEWAEVFSRFIRRLSQQEVAELLVLRLLGKEQTRDPETWNELVEKASKLSLVTLYDLPTDRLPQYLRLGMERLVRHRFKKPKEDPALEKRRVEIIGRCFLQIYREKFGKDNALKALGDYLNGRGFLETPDDRVLFGLPLDKSAEVEPRSIRLDSTIS